MHEKIWCKNGQQMGAAKRAGPSSLLYFQKKASAGDDRHMTRAMSDDYEHGTRATAGAPNLNHGMVIRFHLFTIWGFLIEIDQCFHAKSLCFIHPNFASVSTHMFRPESITGDTGWNGKEEN
jgi:hypothetical protein